MSGRDRFTEFQPAAVTLADELLGRVTTRRLPVSRRNFCVGDQLSHYAAVAEEEKRQANRNYHANWRANNPDKVKAMREREYAKRDKVAEKARQEKWRANNLQHVRTLDRLKARKRRKEKGDAINLRRRQLHALRFGPILPEAWPT